MELQAAAAAAAEPTGKSPLIQGLKHKILVHLLKKKQEEAAAGNHEALKQFHYVFETYVNLLIWKVGGQLLHRRWPSHIYCSMAAML